MSKISEFLYKSFNSSKLPELKLVSNSLNDYELFHVAEFNVNNNETEIKSYINKKFQTLLSSCYFENISVVNIFSYQNGKTNLFLGFKQKNSTDESNTRKEFYNTILKNNFSFKVDDNFENTNFLELTRDTEFGGIICGTALNDEDDKFEFDIASILKGLSLNNKKTLVAIFSSPIEKNVLENYKNELYHYSTKPKEFIKNCISDKSSTYLNEQNLWIPIRHRLRYRLKLGINIGLWETAISFVTQDKISADTLKGTFLGELANNSDQILQKPISIIQKKEQSYGMYLPEKGNKSSLFKKLHMYLTSSDLSIISSFPSVSIGGFEIKKTPSLGLNDVNFGINKNVIGNIIENGIENVLNTFSLSNETLNKHVFITGITGSGKSTTVKQILKTTFDNFQTPFLVIESAKRDYRQLLEDPVFKDKLRIYTIGDTETSPIKINPFYVQKGVKLSSHIDFLKAIFNASFSLYGPMPDILEKCLNTVYEKLGWDLITGLHHSSYNAENGFKTKKFYNNSNHHYFFPTLKNLKNEIELHVNQIGYKGEIKDNIKTALLVRLDKLTTGANGLMFNTYDFHPIEKLLLHPTIFEMEDLVDDDDKAFFVGLLITLISEYRQKENPVINPDSKKNGLQHVLVIEEAHRLLKNVSTEKGSELMGNPKGKAVELFGNVLAEMRSMGQGVIIAEQIPSKLAPEVIKNSNTKIVHRIVAKDDQSLLAGSLSITDKDALYLNQLSTGHALCHKEGMGEPIEVVFKNEIMQAQIGHEEVNELMKKHLIPSLHSNRAYQLQEALKDEGKQLIAKFLNSLGISGEDYLNELFDTLLKELYILIRSNSNYNFFIDKDLIDYATLQSIELFRDGDYNIRGILPTSLIENIRRLFTLKDQISYDQLTTELESYYKEKYAIICCKIIQNKVEISFKDDDSKLSSKENIIESVKEYILIEDIHIKKIILDNTKDKLWKQSTKLKQLTIQNRISIYQNFLKKWILKLFKRS